MKELKDFETQNSQTVEAFGCPCESDPAACIGAEEHGASRAQIANGASARYWN